MFYSKEKDDGSILNQFSPEEVDVFLDKGDVSTVNHAHPQHIKVVKHFIYI